ncbi:MAG: TolC family protein [Vulcanimicrobiaceae bacterium]
MCRYFAVIARMCVIVISLNSPLSAKTLVWNGPLTSKQAVLRAQEAFTVQLANLDSQTAVDQAHSARAETLPQVALSETAMRSSLVQLGMPDARQAYSSFTAVVPLFVPQLWAASRAAGLSAGAARAVAAMALNQAGADAAFRYNAAALAAAIVLQRDASVEAQRSHLTVTLQRIRAGKMARYLLARDQAALARARQAKEDAIVNAVRALHILEVPLNIDPASAPILSLDAPTLGREQTVVNLELRANEQRPDVVSAQLALAAAKERLTRSRAEFLPTLVLSAQTYNGASNPALGSSGFQIGVTASMPLVDGGSRFADANMANVAVERARIELERTVLQVKADVLDAVRELHAARRNIATTRAELRSAQTELRIARVRERTGKGIENETLDALAAVAEANEEVLRATARFWDAEALVHRAVGDYGFGHSW